jgi:hypothetical protein
MTLRQLRPKVSLFVNQATLNHDIREELLERTAKGIAAVKHAQ